jgi:hypothetical protein
MPADHSQPGVGASSPTTLGINRETAIDRQLTRKNPQVTRVKVCMYPHWGR